MKEKTDQIDVGGPFLRRSDGSHSEGSSTDDEGSSASHQVVEQPLAQLLQAASSPQGGRRKAPLTAEIGALAKQVLIGGKRSVATDMI